MKTTRLFTCLLLLSTLVPALALASPYPATGASVLTDPTKGVFFHGFGFRLSTLGTTWAAIPTAGETVFDTLRFEPRDGGETDATLSIRMDKMTGELGLEAYAKKWIRDYSSYGFEILGTRPVNLGGGKALVVDLLQKERNRQLRQVLLQKDKQVAIVTCLDRKDRFGETLQACNKIIKSFQWADDGLGPTRK